MKKGYTFAKSHRASCELCGRELATPQALRGHMQFKHPGMSVPTTDRMGTQPEIDVLRQEVARLKLERQKLNLTGLAPAPAAAPVPDITTQLGLGSMQPEVQAIAQKRALNMPEAPPRAESWFSQLMANPAAMAAAVAGLKGILGVNSGGDLSVLKTLGIDLVELLKLQAAPRAPSDFKVGSVSLAGAQLTPEVFHGILAYETAREDREAAKLAALELQKYETAKSKLFLDGWNLMVGAVSKAGLLDGAAERFGGNIARRGRSPEPEPEPLLTCPTCKNDGMPVVLENREGRLVCSSCNQEFEESSVLEPGARGAKPVTIVCDDCNQLVDVSALEVGQPVKCGFCGKVGKLQAPGVALPAAELTREDEERLSS